MQKFTWYLILDFDSTIIKRESLDFLSEIVLKDHKDKDFLLDEIKDLTNKGMSGVVSFQESINQRLKRISITIDHIKILNEKLTNYITPSFQDNIEWLKRHSNHIYIISGGFKEIIIPIADIFNISHDHIFANDFIFNQNGIVSGLNKNNPLSRSGGKLKKAKELNLDGRIYIVGDGFTDAEIKNLGKKVDFVAFIENIYREKVVSEADFTARSFEDVINFIKNSERVSFYNR